MGRKLWLDIAKGIGIISVVIGHAGIESLSRYLFWFHMPLFFLISGYLYKKTDKFVLRKTRSLLIPYISFFVLLSFLQYFIFGIPDFEIHFDYFLKGGKYLKGVYGVFWFITSLYVLTVLFHTFYSLSNKIVLFFVAIIFYFLSYFDSTYIKDSAVIWNINTILFTFIFYFLGHCYKLYEDKVNLLMKKVVIYTTILLIVFVTLNVYGRFEYSLDIKNQLYNHLFLDIVIPVMFILCVFWVSKKLEQVKVINRVVAKIGESSLTIMYLHILFLTVFKEYTHLNVWLAVLFTIILSYMSHQLFKASGLTSKTLLGIYERKIESKMEISP
ncbi:acyltransferase family protein [Bacillus sp. FJAT-50079]|uniref:acyltransferase family protein n=1 Tax=Bacillus sp. FJAT-50079 TaxID=2833577 RepID=UPI001BCA48F0|nr:acyltransferase family protein [Bacillus sp. FJAT-50079]MBS4206746.1 acyltransferase family protein [Bacillus sp. FJAT-50079]